MSEKEAWEIRERLKSFAEDLDADPDYYSGETQVSKNCSDCKHMYDSLNLSLIPRRKNEYYCHILRSYQVPSNEKCEFFDSYSVVPISSY